MRKTLFTIALLSTALAACEGPESDEVLQDDMTDESAMMDGTMAGQRQASATLYAADGMEVGGVIARETDEGVMMNISLSDMPTGSHGAHIHEVGACQPDFMAAGDHWGPFDEQLNLANDDASDNSDNATISVGEDGAGEIRYVLGGEVTLEGMLEGDGSSFVIHQRSTDPALPTPSGDGDRVACGVFAAAG
jgi:Cu-Zn family superoxide dismutase